MEKGIFTTNSFIDDFIKEAYKNNWQLKENYKWTKPILIFDLPTKLWYNSSIKKGSVS